MTTNVLETSETVKQRHREVQERLNVDNPEAVPTIEKTVVNVGLGDAPDNVSRLEAVQDQLERITGQTPVVTRARKSVAGFGIRRGDPAGVKVTLRRDKMHNFLQKLIHLALPRTRDFSGLDPTSIDPAGNYSLGIDEQVIFPEISFEEAEDTTRFGMDVTLVTSTDDPEEALVLLTEYGLPFKDV